MRASLHRAMLTYRGGLVLHTASSGRVDGLDTLYLRLEQDGLVAAGEVRINIAYLNGLAAEAVLAEALDVLGGLDFARDAASLLAEPPAAARASAPVRTLIDCALHDMCARQAGVPLAVRLGAPDGAPITHATNQTLFVSSDETFLARAAAYVARGFTELKVRIGAGDIADDLRRVALLRERFGTGVTLAADANGAWELPAALAHLDALARYDLAYVEQPVAPGDWKALDELAARSPIPVMLDESVTGLDEVRRIADAGNGLMAHLKLVKLGGLTPALEAARLLSRAGVPFMIGQMNEGGLATSAALHLACATRPRFAELYGADGLENDPAGDPATCLAYGDGHVSAPPTPGLGLRFDASRTHLIREFS
ncbi:mandelate racemase/muconate lactonizing enzyme family protein [Ancylobacter sp. MQZ15Z-1]|uniref:Mandelate racemase/muconate lactonizing enzyme family protein n=1 Tax=Ancylobacter mangrovi TaxID=2972472 RepID=A0A9X2PBL0_9HYPH|nr:mandelate racemase/muconate lactonizing enzyme family protein [Ancylobacter mangrovi]MCS0495792.1 mandelate racemase/muconate lactonizing enzyme family protein [Ancylobacter mangrovi]